MAGYSGTPLPQKLGIKSGHRVLLANAPKDFKRTLGKQPAKASLHLPGDDDEAFDVILLFVTNLGELQWEFAPLKEKLVPNGGLWVAWPKKASGTQTDLTENVIREVGLKAGLVDNKVCAIDETWSGLRFVIRVKDRPKEKNQTTDRTDKPHRA
jgi:hypothetical protein